MFSIATSQDKTRKTIVLSTLALAGIFAIVFLLLLITNASLRHCGYDSTFYSAFPWCFPLCLMCLTVALAYVRCGKKKYVCWTLVGLLVVVICGIVYDCLLLSCADNYFSSMCNGLANDCPFAVIPGAGLIVGRSFNLIWLLLCVVWSVYFYFKVERLGIPLPVAEVGFFFFFF